LRSLHDYAKLCLVFSPDYELPIFTCMGFLRPLFQPLTHPSARRIVSQFASTIEQKG
jgi:hypothetical protein